MTTPDGYVLLTTDLFEAWLQQRSTELEKDGSSLEWVWNEARGEYAGKPLFEPLVTIRTDPKSLDTESPPVLD